MSRLLLHFFHSDRAAEELARWERSAQLLEKNLFLLEGKKHLDPSSIERARQALQQAKSHLRPAA